MVPLAHISDTVVLAIVTGLPQTILAVAALVRATRNRKVLHRHDEALQVVADVVPGSAGERVRELTNGNGRSDGPE